MRDDIYRDQIVEGKFRLQLYFFSAISLGDLCLVVSLCKFEALGFESLQRRSALTIGF